MRTRPHSAPPLRRLLRTTRHTLLALSIASSAAALALTSPRAVLANITEPTTRPTPSASSAPTTDTTPLPTASQFLRFTDDPTRPRLEVSIVRLKGDDGVILDLVSAVHIADPGYYQDLNHRFGTYDAVLYEMVKARGTTVPAPSAGPTTRKRGTSAVSSLQRGMKTIMGLSFQLDEVDYTPANFVHADLDADSFRERQAARGESLMSLMMQAYMQQMAGGGDSTGGPTSGPVKYQPLKFGTTVAERQHALKIMLATMFDGLERRSLGLDGPDGSAILTDRNDACLKVFREQRAAGKKKMAVFYGAAHMPDLVAKLTRDDRLKITSTEWLTAWDLTPPPPTKEPAK